MTRRLLIDLALDPTLAFLAVGVALSFLRVLLPETP
jgi:hypothetical protein